MQPAKKYLKGHYFFRGGFSLLLPFVLAGLFLIITSFSLPNPVFADYPICNAPIFKPPTGNYNYTAWGLWYGPTDTNITSNNHRVNFTCSNVNTTDVIWCQDPSDSYDWKSWSTICVQWDTSGVCNSESWTGSQSWPYDYIWKTPNGSAENDQYCVNRWVRYRECDISKPKGFNCMDTRGIKESFYTKLWDGHFTASVAPYSYTDNGNGTWSIRYFVGITPIAGGGTFQGEGIELRTIKAGTFCAETINTEGPTGLGYTCTKTEPIETPVSNYTKDVGVWIADKRNNLNIDVPPETLSCTFAPTPGTVHPGETSALNTTVTGGVPPYNFYWLPPSCGTLSDTSSGDVQNPIWTAIEDGEMIGNRICGNRLVVSDAALPSASSTACNNDVEVADFSLSLSVVDNNICKGNIGIYQLTATAIKGWNKEIDLSCSTGSTPGAIYFFSNNSNCSSNDGNKITPTGSKYVCVDTSSTTDAGTYAGISVRGKVKTPGDPSDGWGQNSNNVDLTVSATGSCVPSCTMSKNPSAVYPGATSALTAVPSPASPPSGASGYNYNWTETLPSCGQFNPAEPVSPPETATWQAKSGSTFVAGVGCTSYVTVTDPGSGLSGSCNTDVDVYDFSLGVSPSIITVNREQSALYTVAALAINGWSRGVNLSIDSISDGVTSYLCSNLANSCTFVPNPITPSSPLITTTLSFNTIKDTTPFHTYTIVVTGTDPISGFPRDSNSFQLKVTNDHTCSIDPVLATVYPGESQVLNATIVGGSGTFSNSWGANCGSLNPINTEDTTWTARTSPPSSGFIAGVTCSPTLTVTDTVTGGTAECSSSITVRDFSLSVDNDSVIQGQTCNMPVNAGAISGWSKQIELSETCPSGRDIDCYYSLNSNCSTDNGETMNVTPTATRYLCVSSSPNTPIGDYSVGVHGEVKSAGDLSNGFYRDASATCTFGCSAPNLPINLTVTPPPATESANVKWDPPASGTVPSSYGIQWAKSSLSYNATVNTTSNTFYNITNLESNTCYKWHVRSQLTCSGDPFYSSWADGPVFCTSAVFSCYVDPSSMTVVPGAFVNPVTTKGSSALTVTSWSSPDCGVLNSSAPTNPVTWRAKNIFGANLDDGAICRVFSTANSNPIGQSAQCTLATYRVAEPEYCCDSVLNSCCDPASPTCSCPGGVPTDNCADEDLGGYCGGGGDSMDFFCNGMTPPSCSISPDQSCSFTAYGSGDFPFVYRFGISPNTSSREYIPFTKWHDAYTGWYKNLNNNYADSSLVLFTPPSGFDKYLDKVEVKLKALPANDSQPPYPTPTHPPRYIGGNVFAGVGSEHIEWGGKILAEVRSSVPWGNPITRDPGPSTVSFDFKVKPRIQGDGHTTYRLGIRTYVSTDVRLGWETLGHNGDYEAKFYFKDPPASGGIGSFVPYPTSAVTLIEDVCPSCNSKTITYYPPITSSDSSFYIGAEVSSSDADVCYWCGGPCGCHTGRWTVGCSALGLASVTAEAWWQGGQGGDIYGRDGIDSQIPAAPTPYLIPGVPGIAIAGSGKTVSTNAKTISSLNNWRINNYALNGIDIPDTKGYSYNYFYDKLKNRVTSTVAGPLTWSDLNIGGTATNPMIKQVNGNLTLGTTSDLSYPTGGVAGTAIVLVDGNLTIDKKIVVGSYSALVFIVSGNISIKSSVTQIDGIYFAQVNFSTGLGNLQLVGNGAWYVSGAGKFNLRRNLGASNTSTPAEKVIFQPKYLLKLMEILGEPTYIWQEVAG